MLKMDSVNSGMKYSSKTLLQGIASKLSRRRRIQLGLLFLFTLLSAVAELISLGSVIPFLAVLSNPDRFFQQSFVQLISVQLGITSPSQLILPAAILFALAASIAALIRITNLWLNGRFAAAVGSDLSCKAYEATLYQPYQVHVNRNSSIVIASTTKMMNRTLRALSAFLEIITAVMVSIGLIVGLIVIDPFVALGAASIFGSLFLLIGLLARNQLKKNSKLIAKSSERQVKALQEGLGSIRDILLNSRQQVYLNIYKSADIPQRKLIVQNMFIGAFPRFLFEAIAMFAIAFLGAFQMLHEGNNVSVLPQLGAVALGSQKLLPVLQKIYQGWSSINAANSDMAIVLEMLDQPIPKKFNFVEPLRIEKNIKLENICFHYSSSDNYILRGLNLDIRCGERIGLVGTTGCGKSTLVDLMMGLLVPSSGKILINGKDLYDQNSPERVLRWRSTISHVPQSIFLADSTIAENIALGLSPKDVDVSLVKNAAKLARIDEFIESLPNRYNTLVGERGSRLSGGQRQRIGIARALYKESSLLILDEATSALDDKTESEIMEVINSLASRLSIVMIAHRVSTLNRCHRVLKLEKGSLQAFT